MWLSSNSIRTLHNKLFRNRPNVERVDTTGGCWVNISLLVSSKYPNPSGKWLQNDKAMEWKVKNSTRSMYHHIYFRVPTLCKHSLYIGYQTQACRKITRAKISWFLGHNQTPHCNKVWSKVTLSFIDQLCSDKSVQNNPNQHEEADGWGGKFMDMFRHKYNFAFLWGIIIQVSSFLQPSFPKMFASRNKIIYVVINHIIIIMYNYKLIQGDLQLFLWKVTQ